MTLHNGMVIYLVEGEQAAEDLQKLGVGASNYGKGVWKWDNAKVSAFRSLNVVIIADKADPERINAMKTLRELYCRVASLKVIELPDRDGRWVRGVSDWLEEGGTREELERLRNEEKEWQPSEKDNMAYLIPIAGVRSESVGWLWYPYLPKSKLTLLEGDPGVGKSWVSLAIASALSLGQGLPGREGSKPAPVLLASAEDGLSDTIRPRLNTMGANTDNIHAIEGPLNFDDARRMRPGIFY